MKHRLPTIVICLLFGVVVNVSVAWACVYWVAFGPMEARQYERNHYGPWTILSWAGFGSRRIVSVRPPSALYDSILAEGWLPTPPAWSGIRPEWKRASGSSKLMEAAEARGWPNLALSVSFEEGLRPRQFQTRLALGGVEIRPPTHPRNPYDASGRTLPLRPVWGGFIANTLLYAAAAWLLSRLPAARRRRIHRARGLCPNCGYPPGASAICTECGAALGVSLVTATDEDGAIR